MKEPLIFSINHIADQREVNAERAGRLIELMLRDMEEAARERDRRVNWATLKIEGRRPDIDRDGPSALLRSAIVLCAKAQSRTD